MSNLGKLIVFEGPDGVGKSELSRRLALALQKNGQTCLHLAFPGNTKGSLGKLVYTLHHQPSVLGLKSLNPTSLQLLHLAAHIEAIESQILPAIRAGTWVVLDRYWWSMWAYGRVSGISAKTLNRMVEIETTHWENMAPTVFLIDRAQASDPTTDRLRKEYQELAAREKAATFHIDNNGSIEQVLAGLLDVLKIDRLPRQKKDDSQIPLALSSPRTTIRSLSPAKTSKVYESYWKFAVERQEIFFRRSMGEPAPWTKDPILQEFKFTNAYRASDRVSQYLIRNVIYTGPQTFEEVFFRTLLFKFFNRIETWELLCKEAGPPAYADFSIARYDRILARAKQEGQKIYSAAYIMPTGGQTRPKHQMHLDLLDRMMLDELPSQIADAKSMGAAFQLLVEYPTIGDFLGYQFITDLNYSSQLSFSEMEFTMPGPGARDGIRKCFTDLGGLTEAEIIRLVAERQQIEFQRLGLRFKSLWGRDLQLIDCQNIFCEVDKYSRVAHPEFSGLTGRTRIKQKFCSDNSKIDYWYPPKWEINERILSGAQYVQSV